MENHVITIMCTIKIWLASDTSTPPKDCYYEVLIVFEKRGRQNVGGRNETDTLCPKKWNKYFMFPTPTSLFGDIMKHVYISKQKQ